MVELLCDFPKNNPAGKPIVLVLHSFANDPCESELRAKLISSGNGATTMKKKRCPQPFGEADFFKKIHIFLNIL